LESLLDSVSTLIWITGQAIFLGHSGSVVNGEMANAWFFQGRVGVKPTPQLDAMLSVSYATADKKTVPYEVCNLV